MSYDPGSVGEDMENKARAERRARPCGSEQQGMHICVAEVVEGSPTCLCSCGTGFVLIY